MSDTTMEPGGTPAPGSGAARRGGPPKWAIVLFLALLGGMVVVNQIVGRSGTPVKWIETDLAAALAQVGAERPRAFLYLYEPNDPEHARNEREVFTQRWAKRPLSRTVNVRVAVGRDVESLRLMQKYNYKSGTPLFLLLSKNGTPMGRIEGAPTELEFLTHIGRPAETAAAHAKDDPNSSRPPDANEAP